MTADPRPDTPEGKTAAPEGQAPADAPASAAGQTPVEDVREALKDVIDPELGVNVVDLGLLYGLHYAEDGALLVDMTLTTAACPLTDEIEEQVSRAIGTMVDEWRLNWVWMPPWGPERITEDGKDQMRALGFNI
ncbi:metal-sulfur cluster assembly factor [Micrococcus sp.]|uniref:metal-sulfur cluster assembly factor n=1 Tax=Micrococcus sp. TaxID=1271 RepID=UPI002A918D17|nr:metal-sulfur cluster assembly factor [Micrococcus sp.]MDY6054483.1 metal-sulfur cluster assembly factor [Micrococcus sp.]